MLTVKAEKDFTLQEFGFDCLQKMLGGKSKISKMRIFGVDNENHNLIIDTEFMGRKTEVDADLNPETGEVITQFMYSELKLLAEEIN